MNIDKAIKTRKSVRAYKNKKPDWRDIIECVDAARYAPMAGNIFSLRFIIVSDKNKIAKLAEAAQQYFISTSEYVVVFCSNPSRVLTFYEGRGAIYCRQQAGAGIQNFLLKIVEKGLSTCWVGHFVDDQVKRILGIPKGVVVEAMFPIGYESGKKWKEKQNPKIELDNVLFFDEYKQKKMKKPKKIKA